jgi:hypothetical protein
MIRTIVVGMLAFTLPLHAATIIVTAQNRAGNPLPESRVALLALSENAKSCRVAKQVITDSAGRATVQAEDPGLYLLAVELAGFIGTELGPFRIEPRGDSEAPENLIAVLHDACTLCVKQPAANDYLLARRCGADDPAQAGPP